MPAPARIHHDTQSRHVRAAGFDPSAGYCGPTALARALAPGGPDDPATLPALIRTVHDKLSAAGIQRGGTLHGGLTGRLAHILDMPGRPLKAPRDESRGGWSQRATDGGWEVVEVYNRRVQYPTVVAWLRDHLPGNVTRAVVRCTGHLGYVERDDAGTWHLYDLRPRARVDHAWILPPRPTPAVGWWATINGHFLAYNPGR